MVVVNACGKNGSNTAWLLVHADSKYLIHNEAVWHSTPLLLDWQNEFQRIAALKTMAILAKFRAFGALSLPINRQVRKFHVRYGRHEAQATCHRQSVVVSICGLHFLMFGKPG
jgi:hypothetical protein